VVSAEQVTREEVIAFLGGQPGTAEGLEALAGGAWSSAWAYRAGGEELVVRFGPETSWYEADRMAMAFAGPDLPVPEVREEGSATSGGAYAISVRHHGRFLEDTPVEQAGAIAPALTRLLVALYRVPAGPDAPVIWHQGGASARSWREFLTDGLVDDPGKLVHGWSATWTVQDKAQPVDYLTGAFSIAVATTGGLCRGVGRRGSEEPRRPRLRGGGHENAWVIVPAGAAASIIS